MRLKGLTALILTATLILAVALASLTVLSQPTEAQAKDAFAKLGCTACHNGKVAKTWDEIVARWKGLSGKYTSLNDFVKAEVTEEVKTRGYGEPKTWDELFILMSTFVGKKREDTKIVEEYLASLLGIGATPTTPTPTPTPTPVTSPATPPAEERGVSFILAAVAAAILVLILVAIAFYLSRRSA